MVHFIEIVDNQLYIAAIHTDLVEHQLRPFPSLKGLTKMVRLALKTFSLAVYLHYPSQRCSYIIKNPVIVLSCMGTVVYGIDILEKRGFDHSRFFKEVFCCLRVVSGFMFTCKFLKFSLQEI